MLSFIWIDKRTEKTSRFYRALWMEKIKNECKILILWCLMYLRISLSGICEIKSEKLPELLRLLDLPAFIPTWKSTRDFLDRFPFTHLQQCRDELNNWVTFRVATTMEINHLTIEKQFVNAFPIQFGCIRQIVDDTFRFELHKSTIQFIGSWSLQFNFRGAKNSDLKASHYDLQRAFFNPCCLFNHDFVFLSAFFSRLFRLAFSMVETAHNHWWWFHVCVLALFPEYSLHASFLTFGVGSAGNSKLTSENKHSRAVSNYFSQSSIGCHSFIWQQQCKFSA